MTSNPKADVRNFWNAASCGEALFLPSIDREGFELEARERYRLEPTILDFAQFEKWNGRRVLEIGVGLGSDHQRFVESGALISGIDLTPRAIEMTRKRLEAFGLEADVQVCDAENIPFSNEEFDLVYSWGVIHHSPDTVRVIAEIHRVLKRGGKAKIMIYSKWSLIGYMLWVRYALMVGKPFRSLKYIYANFLESPGTKAYSIGEARTMFTQYKDLEIDTVLTHGDLLTSEAGQRHEGATLSLARRIWPRWLIKLLLPKHGLFMLISATK
jgi:SAM-dependent methyltransferase